MIYEIGNPSDKCFLEADDEKIAAACVLFLGDGQYFCINTETGKQVPGTFFAFGGDPEKTWKEIHGIGLDELFSNRENKIKIAECFESFRYAGTRTSLNNIGERAEKFAASMRRGAQSQGGPR